MNTIIKSSENKKVSIDVNRKALLNWAQQSSDCCFLDHNNYKDYPGSLTNGYLAVGAHSKISIAIGEENALPQLQAWLDSNKDWAFGYFSYDLKNQIENVRSDNPLKIDFGLLHFFVPKYLFEFLNGGIQVVRSARNRTDLVKEINDYEGGQHISNTNRIEIKSDLSKAEYLEKIEAIKSHIQLGDIYEMNFCQEFSVNNFKGDPLNLFHKLNKNSRAPFASFFKVDQKYLVCSSPERFLQKNGSRLISQPIKGTRKRGEQEQQDILQKKDLINSQKDRSEHVMIVDLVRNDLGKICHPGTVKAVELFGIYSFEHVHQMISTIEGELCQNKNFTDIIKATFPMGSMTGAPKISAMNLIDHFEQSARGLYSGSVGYIKPNGDFDFNVVIRSMLLDQNAECLSFHVGGAIVADSDPEMEYEECFIKARGIHQALFGQ